MQIIEVDPPVTLLDDAVAAAYAEALATVEKLEAERLDREKRERSITADHDKKQRKYDEDQRAAVRLERLDEAPGGLSPKQERRLKDLRYSLDFEQEPTLSALKRQLSAIAGARESHAQKLESAERWLATCQEAFPALVRKVARNLAAHEQLAYWSKEVEQSDEEIKFLQYTDGWHAAVAAAKRLAEQNKEKQS